MFKAASWMPREKAIGDRLDEGLAWRISEAG
jgi:hypothetical protein